jgi:hypothetical protein
MQEELAGGQLSQNIGEKIFRASNSLHALLQCDFANEIFLDEVAPVRAANLRALCRVDRTAIVLIKRTRQAKAGVIAAWLDRQAARAHILDFVWRNHRVTMQHTLAA